ncbi:ATP-binding protein [Nonomuraea sp. NBC_01738]|nr:ATP-binding protein [Nonomuraea sp. NBC_01738]
MTAGDFAGASALLLGTGTHQPDSDLPDIPAVGRTLDDLRRAFLGTCGLAEVRAELDLAGPMEMGAAISETAGSARGPLIVYYVGHGLVSRRGALYLATGRTRSGPLHLEHTALPYDTMRRYLLDNVDAPVAVILDCCFSGRAIEGMGPQDEVAGLAEITGAYVLTSAGRSEPSFAPAGQPHTAFSGALLRLLREGDPGGPPYLTLQHVHRHLSRTLPAAGFPRPRARSTGRAGEMALARNPAHGVDLHGVRLSPASVPEGAPYKGLAAFGEQDAALFFGRERLVAELVRRLAVLEDDPAPLIVTGASGSGKSSLLRAGLAPALRQGALGAPRSVAVVRPGSRYPRPRCWSSTSSRRRCATRPSSSGSAPARG